MIDPAQIPDEVVEAAARALADDAKLNWDDVPFAQDVMRGEARAAIAAALNAWPGMTFHQQDINAEYSYFVLPLPHEARDEPV